MSWYEQSAAGFKKLHDGLDVHLLDRKERTGTSGQAGRRDTQEYTELVIREVELMGGLGTTWVAPEAHLGDPGVGDAWHWHRGHDASPWHGSGIDLTGTSKMLEAIYPDRMTLSLYDQLDMHDGMGWQFPQLIVFDNEPLTGQLGMLRDFNTPYLVLSDVELPPPPEEEDDEEIPVGEIEAEEYLRLSISMAEGGKAEIPEKRRNLHRRMNVALRKLKKVHRAL